MPEASKEPLDALSLAAAMTVVEREFPLAGFARLVDRLAAPDGRARARVAWRTTGGVPTAELEVRAEVMLTCQRCLRPMRQMLQSTSQLAFVAREDEPAPADHESIPGDPRRVDMTGLIEDELLLSLPLIAIHGGGETCLPQAPQASGVVNEGPAAPEMRRPFAGLKDLLKH